jgi:hypothetical protein
MRAQLGAQLAAYERALRVRVEARCPAARAALAALLLSAGWLLRCCAVTRSRV